jgi:hypothetical protein
MLDITGTQRNKYKLVAHFLFPTNRSLTAILLAKAATM